MRLDQSLTVLADIIGVLTARFPDLPVETAPNMSGARYIRLDGLGFVDDLLYKGQQSGTHRVFLHVIDKGTESLAWVLQTMAQADHALKEATIAGASRALQSESGEALFEPQTDESFDAHGIIRYRLQLGA